MTHDCSMPSRTKSTASNRQTDALHHQRDEGIRWELVLRVRGEIAAGTYETPQKLAAAIDHLSQRHFS